jgi:hypothetical protein
MTVINQLYASSGSEAIIQTLQINVGMQFIIFATVMKI